MVKETDKKAAPKTTETLKREKATAQKAPKAVLKARTQRAGTSVKQKKADLAFGVKSTPKVASKSLVSAVEMLAQQLVSEQKAKRRWGIFFKLSTLAVVVFIVYLSYSTNNDSAMVTLSQFANQQKEAQPFTAVVEVKGIIFANEPASSDDVIDNLQSAFEHENTQAIILDINSPGGSPVQAGQIYDEIVRLRAIYAEVPVYAVISDVGASAAYYIAAAADKIYADKSSLVGSIGVISSGFGFTELMENLGVERRLIISGKNKAFLDPFSKEDKKSTEFWQSVLDLTHQQFIDSVKRGRGSKINSDNSEIFSGLIFNGEQALNIGLVDALGDKRFVAREEVGYENLVYFTNKGDEWLNLIRDFSKASISGMLQSLKAESTQRGMQ